MPEATAPATPTTYEFVAWFVDCESIYKCYLIADGTIVAENQQRRSILPLTWHKINGQVMIAHVSFPKSRPAMTLPLVFDAGVMTGSKELAESLERLLRLVFATGEASGLHMAIQQAQHAYNAIVIGATSHGLCRLFDLPTEPAPEQTPAPSPPAAGQVAHPPSPTVAEEGEDDTVPSTGEDYVVG